MLGFAPKEWPLQSLIGKGAYGVVTSHESPSGGLVAIKSLKFGLHGEAPSKFTLELNTRDLDHPNVMGICSVGITKGPGWGVLKTNMFTR
jgi:hypothetical protein